MSVEVLSTRELSQPLCAEAASKGIEITVSAFIKTEPVENVEVQQEIEAAAALCASVVFTSANAVESVAAQLGFEPDWRIFCLGHATAFRAQKLFPDLEIISVGENATELAEFILQQEHVEEVIFFCGDRRRAELPLTLRKAGVAVQEVIVYQTVSLPHRVKGKFSAVLFFSPSGVQSYFASNEPDVSLPLFAIGPTTAEAIRERCGNEVIVADSPTQEAMLNELIDYFF